MLLKHDWERIDCGQFARCDGHLEKIFKNFMKRTMQDSMYKELEKLSQEGLIQPSQLQAIQNYYASKPQGVHSNRFIQVLSIVWAILVWLGIILWIGANREVMSDLVKTILLIGIMIALYALGFKFYYQGTYVKTWYALVLLGALVFGANIFLLGQIYNVGWTYYDAFGIWMIGLLPLIYMTGHLSLLILGFVVFYSYFISYFTETEILPFWGVLLFFSGVGLTLYSLARLHTATLYDKFPSTFRIFSIITTFSSFFLFTFSDLTREILEYPDSYISLWPLAVIAVLVIVSRIVHYILNKNSMTHLAYLVHSLVLIGLWLIFGWAGYWDFHTLLMVFINLYFMAMIFYHIRSGIKENHNASVNIAIIACIVFIIAKYFDRFYTQMDKAIFFIIGGILLLVSSTLLEKRRQRLLQ